MSEFSNLQRYCFLFKENFDVKKATKGEWQAFESNFRAVVPINIFVTKDYSWESLVLIKMSVIIILRNLWML